jgi:hypothetical protein
MIEVPTRSDLNSYSQRVELDGVIYNLNFRFNERLNLWVMDVLDSDEADILIGLPLLVSTPLMFQYVKAGKPPGDFVVLNRENRTDENPSENNLGTDFKLYYITEAELNGLTV